MLFWVWWRGDPPYNGLWGGFVQIWYSKFWYVFHGSGTWKGWDFTDWGIWKPGRENCRFSLLKAPKALRDAFYGSEKSRNSVHLQQAEGDEAFSKYVKGVPIINKSYTKEVPFLTKLLYKLGKGLDLGTKPPLYKTFFSTPRPGLGNCQCPKNKEAVNEIRSGNQSKRLLKRIPNKVSTN